MKRGKVYDVKSRKPLDLQAPFITADEMGHVFIEGHWGARPGRPVYNRNGDNVCTVYGNEDWVPYLPADGDAVSDDNRVPCLPADDDAVPGGFIITENGVMFGESTPDGGEMFDLAAKLGWRVCGWDDVYEFPFLGHSDESFPNGIMFFGMK